MIKNLNLEKAVDYLIDETPEGASVRDGADPCRLSDRQRSDRWKKRWRRALPLIVRLCAEGRWKATGKKPGSAVPEHIPDIHFNGSEINGCGDLMSTPGPMPFRLSRRPGPKVVLWTELRFSVPGGADEGKAAELPELKQDEGRPPDSEQGQLGRKEQRTQETRAKYRSWYDRSQKIKADNKAHRPIEIAKVIAKEEIKAGNTKANAETIKRRLNEHYSGWAD